MTDIETGHLVYIHHGLGAIRRLTQLGQDFAYILNATPVCASVNYPLSNTFSGLQVAVDRVCEHLHSIITCSRTPVKRLSFVSTSFGGNIMLRVVEMLEGKYVHIERFAFVTFASPLNGILDKGIGRTIGFLIAPFSPTVDELMDQKTPSFGG